MARRVKTPFDGHQQVFFNGAARLGFVDHYLGNPIFRRLALTGSPVPETFAHCRRSRSVFQFSTI
jgi:hypothetical protein